MSPPAAAHHKTGSAPEVGVTDQDSRARSLLNLINCVRNVANDKSFVDVESTFIELSALREQNRGNVQKIQHLEARLKEVEEQHDAHQRKLLRNHHEGVAAVEATKDELNRQLLAANSRANEKDEEAVRLRNANTELNKHTGDAMSKVEATQTSLAQSQKEVEDLLSKVHDKEQTIQKQKADLSRQGDTIEQRGLDIKTLRKDIKIIRTDLEKRTTALAAMQAFAAPLREDDTAKTLQEFNELWDHCVTAVQSCFGKDLHESVLQDPKALDGLQNSDILEHDIPLAVSNSVAAKAARIVVVLALVSRLMVDRIFKTTWLVEGDLGLRRELYFLAQNDQSKEGFTRALLASLGDPVSRESYILSIVQQAHRQVKGLLGQELADKFRKDLRAIFAKAARLWEDLQLRKSHIEVDFGVHDDQPSLWRSVKLSSAGLEFNQEEVAVSDLAVDVVGITVFPCVSAVGPQGEVPVVPGTVFPVSQTATMKQEIAQTPKSPGAWRRTTASIERRKTTSKKRRDTLHNGDTFLE